MPTLAAFFHLLVGVALLILATYGLRWVWVRAVPPKILAWLIAPGVAVHELSHAGACVLTGAKVHSMVLFRPDGSGEVRHGPPKLKYIGDMFISLAPLLGCTLCLWLLGLLLHSPVNLYEVQATGVQPSEGGFLLSLVRLVWEDLLLAVRTTSLADWRTWVFLYFAMCFTLGMAPSRQDLKNSSVGVLVVAGAVLVLHLVVDRLIGAKADGPVFRFVGTALVKLHYPFAICAITLLPALLLLLLRLPFAGRKRR
ncbi:MAG: M50 family metallopeptidase [Planctomycetes bacterium]|nr:M50 family metallopeptidase [Planctomycetota bacterium]